MHAHGSLLDLDAAVFGEFVPRVVERIASASGVQSIIDVGSGPGSASLELARLFPGAGVVAIDKSSEDLARLDERARESGMDDRMRTICADLDDAWPSTGSTGLVWAASSMHHFADPDDVLRNMYQVLKLHGVIGIVEMAGFPRFLPNDIGIGRPGLEARCHDLARAAGWNDFADWGPPLERAGFTGVTRFHVDVDADPQADDTRQYAHGYFSRIRHAFAAVLAPDDLAGIDRLLADSGAQSLLNRNDLTARSRRTAWTAAKALAS